MQINIRSCPSVMKKIAAFAEFSFFACVLLWIETKWKFIKRRQRDLYSALLTEHAWSIKVLVCGKNSALGQKKMSMSKIIYLKNLERKPTVFVTSQTWLFSAAFGQFIANIVQKLKTCFLARDQRGRSQMGRWAQDLLHIACGRCQLYNSWCYNKVRTWLIKEREFKLFKSQVCNISALHLSYNMRRKRLELVHCYYKFFCS